MIWILGMARPLRIEFAGAVYHVTSRGNARRPIVRDDADRRAWLRCLADVVGQYHWLCHAYCLLNNHFHLLIETPEGNLAQGMRQLNGVYTQQFNRRHNRVGHLYQGRYKAILIQKDTHLLEVCRYVVLNPVRAKSVSQPQHWRWSSYRATAGYEKPAPGLHVDWVLAQFGRRRGAAEDAYRAFVKAGIGKGSLWDEVKGQSLLGDAAYVKRLRRYLRRAQPIKEYPRAQRFLHRPSLEQLFGRLDRQTGKSRDQRIVQAVFDYGYTQRAVADHLGLHYSTISQIVSRCRSGQLRSKN